MTKNFKQEAETELEKLAKLQDADMQRLGVLQAENNDLTNRVVERRGGIRALQKLLQQEMKQEKGGEK